MKFHVNDPFNCYNLAVATIWAPEFTLCLDLRDCGYGTLVNCDAHFISISVVMIQLKLFPHLLRFYYPSTYLRTNWQQTTKSEILSPIHVEIYTILHNLSSFATDQLVESFVVVGYKPQSFSQKKKMMYTLDGLLRYLNNDDDGS